jgi:hypothetical protein
MNWTKSKSYTAGTVVVHQDKLYRKLGDGDDSAPDSVPGGWAEIPPERNNLAEYTAIEASLGSYEKRKAKHQAKVAAAKASAEAKLKALGLTVDELQALGLGVAS